MPELELRRTLHSRGLRYRVNRPLGLDGVRRRADLTFVAQRVVVFVDGCFWHACPTHGTWPEAGAAWWREKLKANVLRDRDTDMRLADAGWTVVRVWEHEDAEAAADAVERVVGESTAAGPR
jgi:DNA mismatch endonuclease (patch repair protein)